MKKGPFKDLIHINQGPIRMWSEIWLANKIWVKKSFGRNKIWVKKNVCRKKMWVKKKLGQKEMWVKKVGKIFFFA